MAAQNNLDGLIRLVIYFTFREFIQWAAWQSVLVNKMTNAIQYNNLHFTLNLKWPNG